MNYCVAEVLEGGDFTKWLQCINHKKTSCTLHHGIRLHIFGDEVSHCFSYALRPAGLITVQLLKKTKKEEQKLSCPLSSTPPGAADGLTGMMSPQMRRV